MTFIKKIQVILYIQWTNIYIQWKTNLF